MAKSYKTKHENTVARASIDKEVKKEAVAVLASMGLTFFDTFRIVLTHAALRKLYYMTRLCPIRSQLLQCKMPGMEN